MQGMIWGLSPAESIHENLPHLIQNQLRPHNRDRRSIFLCYDDFCCCSCISSSCSSLSVLPLFLLLRGLFVLAPAVEISFNRAGNWRDVRVCGTDSWRSFNLLILLFVLEVALSGWIIYVRPRNIKRKQKQEGHLKIAGSWAAMDF